MDGTTIAPGVAAVLDAARGDVVAARRARFAMLERIRELRDVQAATAVGYRSVRRLIQELWCVDAGEAGRLVTDADDLLPTMSLVGESLPARLPATGDAARAGLVGEQHVRVIRRTMAHLDRVPGIDPDALAAAEKVLAGVAPTLPPKSLEKAAHQLVEQLDPDGAAPPEDPELGDELLIGKRSDGSLALTARLHGRIEVEMITEVLDALSAPAGPDDTRSLGKRRAEVLTELFAQALGPAGMATEEKTAVTEPGHDSTGTDNDSACDTGNDGDGDAHAAAGAQAEKEGVEPSLIPAPRAPADPADDPAPAVSSRPGCPTVRMGGQPVLHLTIDARWLQQQIGHGTLDSGTPVHPGSLRRWACDAGIVPMVLGTDSQPLDIGRMTRTVPEGLRRALIHRDGGCAFPGCTRRPKRCAAHHIEHWADGGDTKIDNLALLCRFHHGVIHHEQWTITMIRGRPWFTPPTWVDPDQTPRPGGRHPIPAGA